MTYSHSFEVIAFPKIRFTENYNFLNPTKCNAGQNNEISLLLLCIHFRFERYIGFAVSGTDSYQLSSYKLIFNVDWNTKMYFKGSSVYYIWVHALSFLDSIKLKCLIKNVFGIKQCGRTDLELAVESLLFCKPVRRYRWIRNWIYPNLFDHKNCPNFQFQFFACFFLQLI